MKPTMESRGSPYITVLASMLLMFSLYLLYHQFNVVDKQASKQVVEKVKQQEHLVRVITLRAKPEKPKARPKAKVRPKKTKSSPSAMPHATAEAVARGVKPAIDATFAMPIQRYLNLLSEKTRARVILFDSQKGQIIGEVDGDQFIMGNVNLDEMSMEARDITSDLPQSLKERVLSLAEAGAKPYKFLIVLPSPAEQRFERLLAEKLTQRGIQWPDVTSIQLQYHEWDHHIMVQIKSAMVKAKVRSIGATIKVW